MQLSLLGSFRLRCRGNLITINFIIGPPSELVNYEIRLSLTGKFMKTNCALLIRLSIRKRLTAITGIVVSYPGNFARYTHTYVLHYHAQRFFRVTTIERVKSEPKSGQRMSICKLIEFPARILAKRIDRN